MGDELAGIDEDVPFDWGGAAQLERVLKTTASTLDGQIPCRNSDAHHAREEWRGSYSREFVGRMKTYTNDGHRLSEAMEQAAALVKEFQAAARREQERREKAREWKREHDDRDLLDKGIDAVGGLFGGGDKPPVPEPEPPPNLLGPPPCVTSRED